MATNTTNYALKKPAQDDFYNIDDHNANMDKIDTALKNHDTAIAGKANTTQIPTKLPADGGNADTVDGKHASDFAPKDAPIFFNKITVQTGKVDGTHPTAPYGCMWLYGDTLMIEKSTSGFPVRVTILNNKLLFSHDDNDFEVYTQENLTSATTTKAGLMNPTDKSKLDGIQSGSTAVAGLVRLYDGVDSTSVVLAATANAVKTAYDKANSAFTSVDNYLTSLTVVIDNTKPSNLTDSTTKLNTYRSQMISSLTNKGVSAPASANLSSIPGYINQIPVGVKELRTAIPQSSSTVVFTNVPTISNGFTIYFYTDMSNSYKRRALFQMVNGAIEGAVETDGYFRSVVYSSSAQTLTVTLVSGNTGLNHFALIQG